MQSRWQNQNVPDVEHVEPRVIPHTLGKKASVLTLGVDQSIGSAQLVARIADVMRHTLTCQESVACQS